MKHILRKNFALRAFMLVALLVGAVSSTWAEEVTDVLNNAFTGVSGSSYASWSDKTDQSGTVYAGQNAGTYTSIQLRSNNNNSGIVVTSSVGLAKSISIAWNSNTADARVLLVYGSESPYTDPTNLYSSDKQGTLLGEIANGTTSLTFDTQYPYIGFRSKSGALYLDEVSITWEISGNTPVLQPAGLSFEETSITVVEGAEFSTPTLVNPNQLTVTYSSDNEDVVIVNSRTGAVSIEGSGTATITASFAGDDNFRAGQASYIIIVEDPNAKGTSTNPYTVAEALAFIETLGTETSKEIYVKGIISAIQEVSTQYGNAVYFISDNGQTDVQLEVYRGRYLNNADFTAVGQIAVGDEVVVYGKVVNYKETTPEFTTGNYIYSLVHQEQPTQTVGSIADLKAKSTGEYNLTLGNAVITYVDPAGKYAFIEDATGAITIYNNSGDLTKEVTYQGATYKLQPGLTLTGVAKVVLSFFQNLPEISLTIDDVTPYIALGTITATQGNAPSPVTVTLAALTGDNASTYWAKYLKVEGVSFNGGTLSQGESTMAFRGYNNVALQDGHSYNIIGSSFIYGSNLQFVTFEENSVEDLTSSDFITTELSFEPDVLELTVDGEGEAYLITNLTSLEEAVIENSNPKVATWESGLVTAHAAGTTTITATIPATDAHSAATATLTVTVVGETTEADEVIVFAEKGYANAEDVTDVVTPSGATSLIFDKGSGNNAPKYYDTGNAVRMYNENTLRILSDREIVKVEFTFATGYANLLVSEAQEGTYANGTWTGSSSDLTFTNGDKQSRIQKIAITYGDEIAIPHISISFADADGTPIQSLDMNQKDDTQIYVVAKLNGQQLGWVPFQVESSNPDVVEVEEGDAMSLVLSANGEGEATITVTIEDAETEDAESFLGATATLAVSVTVPEEVISGYVFHKVSAIDNLTGDDRFLFVYEDEEQSLAFNGALEKMDAANNGIAVNIEELVVEEATDEKEANIAYVIPATTKLLAASFTISEEMQETEEGTTSYAYVIRNMAGTSIGQAASKNGLTESADEQYNSINFDENGNVVIAGEGGRTLEFNANKNDMRFRYYGGTQKPIALYRYVDRTTGIANLTGTPTRDNNIYDLAGRRVTATKAGLYIVGGRKVLVK